LHALSDAPSAFTTFSFFLFSLFLKTNLAAAFHTHRFGTAGVLLPREVEARVQ